MGTASHSSAIQIARIARKRGYIIRNINGRRGVPWSATIQAPIDGRAQVWIVRADRRSDLIAQIEAMPEIPRTEFWNP